MTPSVLDNDRLVEPTGSNSSFGYQIGEKFLRPLIRPAQPMGAWTGLPSSIGAPLSGALWGAGLGALYQGGKRLWDYLGGEEETEELPWWKHPAVLGALGGSAVGLLKQSSASQLRAARLSAHEKKSFSNPALLARVISEDPSISFYEKNRLLGLVEKASPSQLSRMAAMATVGALTASAAYGILGIGAFGSAAVGAVTAGIAHNLIPKGITYV